MSFERGTVVLVSLDAVLGHEQPGMRPCVVVSDPDITDDQRFPLLCVVPVTGTPGEGALYPRLMPGSSGLRKSSTALVDQVRSIDKRRIHSVFGTVAPEELAAIDEGIILFLGLFNSSA
jgi:mRNA interferase MazF